MIDVHCHLQFKAFENDYDEVIKNAFDAGITTIINTGTQLSSSRSAVEFAKRYKNLYAIVGVHPHHADKIRTNPDVVEETEGKQEKSEKKQVNDTSWLEELEKLTKHPKVLAIGEIGLDYFSYKSNGIVEPKLQKEIFIQQIELAHRVRLPLQIHNRLAGEDVIEILKERKHLLQTNPGMFHCFAGTKEVLKDALKLGFSIGFDGNSTYNGLAPKETVELTALAKLTPLIELSLRQMRHILHLCPIEEKEMNPSMLSLQQNLLHRAKVYHTKN